MAAQLTGRLLGARRTGKLEVKQVWDHSHMTSATGWDGIPDRRCLDSILNVTANCKPKMGLCGHGI